jgi:hypothetical protein
MDIRLETHPHGAEPFRVLTAIDFDGKGEHIAIPCNIPPLELAEYLETLASKLRGFAKNGA